jgi:8-oxo-dGTP diphosphatase
MDIAVNDILITVNHEYPDFCITMHCFYCESKSKDLTLNEHKEFKWLLLSELEFLDWAAADIPVVNKLRNSGK